jgi:hypothetical protein
MLLRIDFGMPMAVAAVCAAFGVEWRVDLDHTRTQSPHHRLDDMIAPDT